MIRIVDFAANRQSMTFYLAPTPNAKQAAALARKPRLAKSKVKVEYGLGPSVIKALDLAKWTPTWDATRRVLTLDGVPGTSWPGRSGALWVVLEVDGTRSQTRWLARKPARRGARAFHAVAAGGPGMLSRSDFEAVAGYPLLVEGMTYPQTPSAGAADDLQGVVNRRLAAVLGGSPKANNPKGVLAALKRAFSVDEVDGVTMWRWNPNSSIGISDVGPSVTGAQASLVAAGTSSWNSIEPLLASLTPLAPSVSFNPDKIESERSIVTSSWMALVGELGADGGPRISRVDMLLRQSGHALFELGKELHIVPGTAVFKNDIRSIPTTRRYVVLPDDEMDYTNFVIVRDQMANVALVWTDYLSKQSAAKPVEDVGAGVVLLERALAVISEAVAEATAAMDSVFIGPGERSALRFSLAGNMMSITDVFSWIDEFGSHDASQGLQEAGRPGVALVESTAKRLHRLVRDLRNAFATTTGGAPRGLRHPRVKTAMQQLSTALGEVQRRADELEKAYRP